MNIRWLVVVALSLIWSTPASTDTLVIKFRSGETQEVILKDKAVNIEGIHFLSAPYNNVKTIRPEASEKKAADITKETEEEKGGNILGDKKEGIRLKWAPPKFGE
ncbi:MAG: hypothetical protein ACK4TF_09210 [Thermodesulfovibrionales bacterium]